MELDELLSYFKTAPVPEKPLKINLYMTIHNVPLFVDNCTKRIREKDQPAALDWLRDLKAAMEKQAQA